MSKKPNAYTAPKNPELVLKHLIRPEDLNGQGTLFGGQMLSWMDIAGAIIAASHAQTGILLAGVNEVNFVTPGFKGDILEFYAWIEKVGRTSIHVRIEARRKHLLAAKNTEPDVIASSLYTYVAINENRQPISVKPLS